MVQQFIPANSVEFETLTTLPVWGKPDEVDTHAGEVEEWYKTLNFYTRDLRLGNISHRHDDIIYLEDMAGLTHALLNIREGAFNKQAWLALGRVASTLELSHSRGGFFRKISRTFHNTEETTLTDNSKSGGWFGKKKKDLDGWN